MAVVRLRGQLEKLAGGPEHRIDGATVSDVLQGLEREITALDGWILDERGVLRRHINVFVGAEPADPDTAVGADDQIEILPAISGG
ncbi:MAG: sulfur-carrier protein [Solirubrobacteraceae bacterium]|jgi:molybdopterin converting factor small subunit|nr:sulfur-carrier protein [Solirubrobacteraceae bacterium]